MELRWKLVTVLSFITICGCDIIGNSHPQGNLSDQRDAATCSAVPLESRFDCHPESNPSKESCEQRGCCFDNSIKVPERKLARFPNPLVDFGEENITVANPVGLPVCFFSTDYVSYNFSSVTQNAMGPSGSLVRTFPSGFPDDVMELQIDFLYETDSRIRVRVFDPSNPDRYEPKFPEVPVVTSPAENPSYSVVLDEAKGTFAILRKNNNVSVFDTRGAGPLIFADQFLQLSTLLSSNYIYGLGQHLDGFLLDTHWRRRFLWNYDTGPKLDVNLYGSHPFYVNIENDGKVHGVFLLNSNGIDVILQPTPAVTFRPLGGILDLYIFLGPNPSDVIQQYTDVIGKPFLPPYWSLGYHQCRYNYYTTNRTREVWQQTIDAQIPFDAQWNDIDFFDKFKDFTIDPVNYAGLPEFVDEVHQADMHYVIITDPGLDADDPPGTYFPYDNGTAEGIFILDSKGSEFIAETWVYNDTVFPDFTNPRAVELWEEYIRRFREELSFDGIWLDMNEPSNFDNRFEVCNFSNPLNNPPYLPPNSEQSDKWLYYRTVCLDAQQSNGVHYNLHNLYGALETVATSKAIKNIRNKRPFVISRSSFAGHGSYAGHWTGDTSSRWYQLYLSIGDVLNFNLFGVPMVGADICGFGENTTVPLCTRWYQVGAFYPFARNHNNEFCIPQDPVSLGEPVITSARNALTQRYLLLPYLYSLFFRAHLTGDPVMKPLFFEFPEDPQTYVIDSEFLWGEGLLFIPYLLENATSVDAYVPEGRWYDWYSGELFIDTPTGVYVSIESDPLMPNIFARGGHIIPVQDPGVTTVASRQNNFRLEVFLGKYGEAAGEMYWDDGDSVDTVETGAYNWIQFNALGGSLTSTLRQSGFSGNMPLGEIKIAGVSSTRSCLLNGDEYLCDYDSDLEVLTLGNITNVSLNSEITFTWD